MLTQQNAIQISFQWRFIYDQQIEHQLLAQQIAIQITFQWRFISGNLPLYVRWIYQM